VFVGSNIYTIIGKKKEQDDLDGTERKRKKTTREVGDCFTFKGKEVTLLRGGGGEKVEYSKGGREG